jgi:hypothetical protein
MAIEFIKVVTVKVKFTDLSDPRKTFEFRETKEYDSEGIEARLEVVRSILSPVNEANQYKVEVEETTT